MLRKKCRGSSSSTAGKKSVNSVSRAKAGITSFWRVTLLFALTPRKATRRREIRRGIKRFRRAIKKRQTAATFPLSRNASSPIGCLNVRRRKYVARPPSTDKNGDFVSRIDAYANQTAPENRGDIPSSPGNPRPPEKDRSRIDGEHGW